MFTVLRGLTVKVATAPKPAPWSRLMTDITPGSTSVGTPTRTLAMVSAVVCRSIQEWTLAPSSPSIASADLAATAANLTQSLFFCW